MGLKTSFKMRIASDMTRICVPSLQQERMATRGIHVVELPDLSSTVESRHVRYQRPSVFMMDIHMGG